MTRYFNPLLTILTFISLFISCKDNPVINTKLTSVFYKTETGSIQYDVTYNGENIVRFGNSSYSFDKNGRVEFENYNSGQNDNVYLNDTQMGQAKIKYRWDELGRLSSTEVIENTILNSASVLSIYPIKRFTYFQNSDIPTKIEYYSSQNKLSKIVEFHFASNKVDSIVEYTERSSSVWANPGPTFYRLSKYENVTISTTNSLKQVFGSLGFVPRDLSLLYQNDVLLPYAIESYDGIYFNAENDYLLDQHQRLDRILSSYVRKIDDLIVFSLNVSYKFNY